MNNYLKRMIFENTQLKEIDKIVVVAYLDPFLHSKNYCIRIGAIRRYEELTGTAFPGKTKEEARFISQVDGFNSWSQSEVKDE